MRNRLRLHAAVVLSSVTLATAACGGDKNAGTSTLPAAATTTTPAPTAMTPAPVTAAPAVATVAATAPVTPEHHSKLGGAVAGGVAGHMIGGKKGALVGAAAGAYIQHRRNKAAREAAAAGNP